jgi:hypothetical protein
LHNGYRLFLVKDYTILVQTKAIEMILADLNRRVRDLPDSAMVTIDDAGKIDTYDSRIGFLYRCFFSFLPEISRQQEINTKTYRILERAFPKSAFDSVFPPTYHAGVPILARQIKQLLISTGMPLYSDLDPQDVRGSFDRLQIEDVCLGDVPPFSSDHGLTLEGRRQVVFTSKVALREWGTSNPDMYWVNCLKRCFGVSTPIDMVVDTPDGLYRCVQKETHADCKYLIFEPLESLKVPVRIIFLQTQTTLVSLHSNLCPEIGGRGVLDMELKLEKYLLGGRKCIFMGYSLGGIQAYLSLLLFPDSADEIFCVANPATTDRIHAFASKNLMKLRSNRPLTMKFYHNESDLIPWFGAKQPYFRGDSDIIWICKIIKPITREETFEVGVKAVQANIFDVLDELLKSFWIYHPKLSLKKDQVQISDLRKEEGDRSPLGLVSLLKACGIFFAREDTRFIVRLQEKHRIAQNMLAPSPPASAPRAFLLPMPHGK